MVIGKERENNPTPRFPAGTPAMKRCNINKPQPNTKREQPSQREKITGLST